MNGQIAFIISKDGSLKLDFHGFQGTKCAEALDMIESLLGDEFGLEEKEYKPEFLQYAQQLENNQIHSGPCG